MAAETATPGTVRAARARRFDWREYVVYIGFVVLFAIFAITLSDDGFLNKTNLLNIARQSAIIAVMAVAMTFVISTAEIDLSVGSVAGLSSVTTAMVIGDVGLVGAIVVGLGTGLVCGAISGTLTTVVRIPSFLVTLGMLGIAHGVAMWISDTAPQPISNETFTTIFGTGTILGIPVLIFWMVAALIVGHVALRRTPFGRRVLATGGNESAAAFSGVNTRRIKFAVLLLSGAVAGLAGMLYAGRFQSGRFEWGEGDELSVIAAAILGGTSLFGGKGSVVGAVTGALLMGLINNGLILMGLEYSQQQIVRGAIIILAVALARR
ncbi:MAG: ABC transporter permease [Solirubrobacteraceae bacterium]|nr:ABC transporter permease [Solirubrobacteraceae bacterium]